MFSSLSNQSSFKHSISVVHFVKNDNVFVWITEAIHRIKHLGLLVVLNLFDSDDRNSVRYLNEILIEGLTAVIRLIQ